MSPATVSATALRPQQRPATSLPRLLPPGGTGPADLGWHLDRHGYAGYRAAGRGLIAAAEAAGLTGRGGAAFPVHRKLAAVAAARGRPVVVANGAEGEPASRKDATLLWLAPHLVLDGLQLAAAAVGAQQAYLYLHREPGGQLAAAVARALAERAAARLDPVPVEVVSAPPRFLAGQETAAVNRISGGPALPAFARPRVFERGVHGSPTPSPGRDGPVRAQCPHRVRAGTAPARPRRVLRHHPPALPPDPPGRRCRGGLALGAWPAVHPEALVPAPIAASSAVAPAGSSSEAAAVFSRRCATDDVPVSCRWRASRSGGCGPGTT